MLPAIGTGRPAPRVRERIARCTYLNLRHTLGPAERPGRGQSPVAASRNASSSVGMSGPLGW